MITLLSPTRTMNMSPVSGTYPPATTPQFLSEAERIISGVKKLSAKELEGQMNLSQKIAENDFHYFQQFDLPTTIQKQAVLAYSGTIYQKLDASTFKERFFICPTTSTHYIDFIRNPPPSRRNQSIQINVLIKSSRFRDKGSIPILATYNNKGINRRYSSR